MNPRRLPGFGLQDGEQLERLWSYLRGFAPITKEMTLSHRREMLTMAIHHFAKKKMSSIGLCNIVIYF